MPPEYFSFSEPLHPLHCQIGITAEVLERLTDGANDYQPCLLRNLRALNLNAPFCEANSKLVDMVESHLVQNRDRETGVQKSEILQLQEFKISKWGRDLAEGEIAR